MKAEEIFEMHIGLNAEMEYSPIKKEDVINAINEALKFSNQQREEAEREAFIAGRIIDTKKAINELKLAFKYDDYEDYKSKQDESKRILNT